MNRRGFLRSAAIAAGALIFGRTQSEQALNLITHAAHPDAKEELIAAASELKLLN